MTMVREGDESKFTLIPQRYEGDEFRNQPYIEIDSSFNGKYALTTQDTDKDMTVVVMTDEDMELLFMAWQVLKKEREDRA